VKNCHTPVFQQSIRLQLKALLRQPFWRIIVNNASFPARRSFGKEGLA
jgi:hypothetical protein